MCGFCFEVKAERRGCMSTDRDGFLVITINHSHAGFFAYVNFALNQVIYAERHGWQPVVNFGPVSGDGPNAFHDPRRGENIWDYYFEPVAGVTYADLEARLDDPNDVLAAADVTTLSTSELWRIHTRDPDSVYPYPHGMHYSETGNDPGWYTRQRARARGVMESHVRVKPHILAKVDAFEREHFVGASVLGVHLRGTDKGAAHGPPALMRIVRPKEYFPHIDAYTDQHGRCKIFVATDQQQFLDQVTKRYGDRVLSHQAIRTLGRRNPFEVDDGAGYRKGEDVLIDSLLLSRTDYLLKCTSAVGEFAMYFNPTLECTDLNDLATRISKTGWLTVRLKRWGYGRYLRRKRQVYRTKESARL